MQEKESSRRLKQDLESTNSRMKQIEADAADSIQRVAESRKIADEA